MRVTEIMTEGLIDTLKRKLGEVKGKLMTSMDALLKRFKKEPDERLTTIESFRVTELGREYESRVDTGALVCAIHADVIKVSEDEKTVSFKHNGRDYEFPLYRMKEAKNANGIVNRPRVLLSYVWNGKTYHDVETSLADRSKLKFTLLVGRNLISMLKLPVHINDRDLKEE